MVHLPQQHPFLPHVVRDSSVRILDLFDRYDAGLSSSPRRPRVLAIKRPGEDPVVPQRSRFERRGVEEDWLAVKQARDDEGWLG